MFLISGPKILNNNGTYVKQAISVSQFTGNRAYADIFILNCVGNMMVKQQRYQRDQKRILRTFRDVNAKFTRIKDAEKARGDTAK